MAYRDVKPSAPPIYSEIPSANSQIQSYRIQQISLLRHQLEAERDRLAELAKTYRHGVNAVDAIDTAPLTSSMACGVGGVGLLTTIIAAPVVLELDISALACGLAVIAGKYISRRLAVNEEVRRGFRKAYKAVEMDDKTKKR